MVVLNFMSGLEGGVTHGVVFNIAFDSRQLLFTGQSSLRGTKVVHRSSPPQAIPHLAPLVLWWTVLRNATTLPADDASPSLFSLVPDFLKLLGERYEMLPEKY